MKVRVFNIINSNLAININDGVLVYEVIKDILPSELSISFDDINRISTAFLNESIGRYATLNPNKINLVKFDIPDGKDIFLHRINDVIENALLGEEYDNLVNNASYSL